MSEWQAAGRSSPARPARRSTHQSQLERGLQVGLPVWLHLLQRHLQRLGICGWVQGHRGTAAGGNHQRHAGGGLPRRRAAVHRHQLTLEVPARGGGVVLGAQCAGAGIQAAGQGQGGVSVRE